MKNIMMKKKRVKKNKIMTLMMMAMKIPRMDRKLKMERQRIKPNSQHLKLTPRQSSQTNSPKSRVQHPSYQSRENRHPNKKHS